MHHGLAFIEQPACGDFGDEEVVIAHRNALDKAAFESGERSSKDGAAGTIAENIDSAEGIVGSCKAPAKMSEGVGLRRFQDVECQPPRFFDEVERPAGQVGERYSRAAA